MKSQQWLEKKRAKVRVKVRRNVSMFIPDKWEGMASAGFFLRVDSYGNTKKEACDRATQWMEERLVKMAAAPTRRDYKWQDC